MAFGAVNIALISIAISAIGAIVALLFKSNFSLNKNLSSVIGIVAALFGIYAGFLGMTGQGELVSYATPFPFASLSLLVNPLSGLLLFVLSLLALVAWIYGLSYMDEYKKQGAMTFGFFMHTFILSMALVVLADNAFWFLVFFELMSLTSYFLVTIEQSKASTHAGLMYMVMAHAGLLMIMAAFLLFGSQAGSLEFEAFRQTQLSPVLASAVFLLTFIGFGIKAGMIPFHSWLPLAHPSAPSNISALMSGGMIKIGVFGIVKVAFDLLQGSEQMIWWGLVIVGFGAVSSVLGVIYALVEHDIKRLLAYHSVENIGIILLGVGVGMVGVASGNNVLAILGLAGGLFHLLNHAVFKGLLFLGAGSITFAAHTKNMELLGGLGRLMPITATCFLIGSLAISALPPLNGFVSEWLIYQGLFSSIMSEGIVVMVVSAVAIVALALTGALAVTCFVKAYGVSFAGTPRSEQAANAKEVPAPMKLAMLMLAAFCVILGVGAHFIVPVFSSIAEATALSQGAQVTASVALVNPASSAFTSTFVIAVVLLIAVLVARLIHSLFGGNQFGEKVALPWATGYKPDVQMAVTATTFATGVEHFYDFFYDLRRNLSSGKGGVARAFDSIVNGARNIEPVSDKYLVDDTVRDVESMSEKIRRIASGDFQKYVLYIVGALIVLLALAVIL